MSPKMHSATKPVRQNSPRQNPPRAGGRPSRISAGSQLLEPPTKNRTTPERLNSALWSPRTSRYDLRHSISTFPWSPLASWRLGGLSFRLRNPANPAEIAPRPANPAAFPTPRAAVRMKDSRLLLSPTIDAQPEASAPGFRSRVSAPRSGGSHSRLEPDDPPNPSVPQSLQQLTPDP
jgi:hypothetical protein